MRRYSLIITLAILLTACAGVGTQHTSNAPDNPAGSTQHGYLTVASNGVTFVQFVNNNGQLTGQLQGVDAMNGQAHPYNEALTGTFNNGQISMSVSWFGISETFTGTFDGSNLILNFPDSNGYLRSTTFQSATIDDYNNAVSNFESQLQAAQQTAVAQQQAAADAQATADAQSTAVVVDATATAVAEQDATATALPTNAPYSAENIYNDFAQVGLADNNGSQDFSTFEFNGQIARPEGGLWDFIDVNSNANMSIATFASTVEVPYFTDQYSSAFKSYTVNNCSLQVQIGSGSPNIDSYINVMKQYCTPAQ